MTSHNRVSGNQTCETAAYIPMTVSTPINLKPIVRKLPISACICDDPELLPTPCGTFILTQRVCFEIPIEIGVKTKIGDPFVNCKNTPDNERCTKPRKLPIYNHRNIPNIIIGNNMKK